MKKLVASAIALLLGGLIYAQDCSEIFISEYLEGSGNNKGVEIYNPTENIINLGVYYVARYSNGANSYTDGGITQLEGFIQPYSTHLLVNGQTTSTETSPACDPNLQNMAQQLDHTYPAPTYMNGNDAIALFKDTGGSGNVSDFLLIDLFGIIGGGMPSDGEGWASVTDVWFYRNVYDTDGNLTGRDSTYISNYIVPDGYYFYKYDLWSANHSLIRKPTVKKGITADVMPTVEFNVTVEWDTVPGGIDQWDSLNFHRCICEYGTDIEVNRMESRLFVYPNPATDWIIVSNEIGITDIQLFDISGKMVLRKNELNGIPEEIIDISMLDKGVYFVTVSIGDNQFSRKILKF